MEVIKVLKSGKINKPNLVCYRKEAKKWENFGDFWEHAV